MAKLLDILVIDDDPAVGEGLKRTLTHTGRYAVRTATSGEEGLALAAQQRPDAVLLDMLMPRMTGADVAARLRAAPATAGVPVIFLTGLMDKAEAEALGGVIDGERFLAKPADAAEIDTALRELLA